jgi:hypothetical protein
MNFRMDKTLRFWVDVAYEDRKWKHHNCPKLQLIADILRELEQRGDAMRYLNARGKVGWKPSPSMLMALADAERDAQDDLADFP